MLNLKTSAYNDLPVQDSSRSAICKDTVCSSNEPNQIMSS